MFLFVSGVGWLICFEHYRKPCKGAPNNPVNKLKTHTARLFFMYGMFNDMRFVIHGFPIAFHSFSPSRWNCKTVTVPSLRNCKHLAKICSKSGRNLANIVQNLANMLPTSGQNLTQIWPKTWACRPCNKDLAVLNNNAFHFLLCSGLRNHGGKKLVAYTRKSQPPNKKHANTSLCIPEHNGKKWPTKRLRIGGSL